MTAWRALAGAATVGQGRSREAVARPAPTYDGLALVRPLRGKRSCSQLCKVWADGARIVEMLDVLSKTYGKGVPEGAQKLKTPQPHAPSRRRCFYLAVLIERSKFTLRYDISLLRNRASHVHRPAILPHADCSTLRRSTAAEPSCARCKQCARPATRMTIGRHCVAAHRTIY
jgi:hypothetical protein